MEAVDVVRPNVSPGDGSLRALKELNIPHQVKFVDLRRGENRSPEYLKVRPLP